MGGTKRPGRRPGSWELRVEIARDPVSGRRRWKSQTFYGNQRQASSELARMEARFGGLDRQAEIGGTVEELFERWVQHLEGRGLERSTIYGYQRKWAVVRDRLGPLPVAAISPFRIDSLYDELRREQVGTGQIRALHAVLRAMFSQARKWRMLSDNPFEDATPPSHHRPDTQAPDVDTVRALIEAALNAGDLMLAALIRVSATLATRRGETIALRWCDIGDGSIRVAASITEVPDGRGMERKSTKTHAIADLPVDANTLEMLETLQREAKKLSLAAGVPWNPEGYVFTNDPTGETPWTLDHSSKRFSRLRETVPGAEKVQLKHLRSFVATALVDNNADIRTAQARLRHRSPQTTQAHYLARRKPAEERAAEALGAALDG